MEQPRPPASRWQEWFGSPAARRTTLLRLLGGFLLAVAAGVALFLLMRGVLTIGSA
jgi:hypothetical protein